MQITHKILFILIILISVPASSSYAQLNISIGAGLDSNSFVPINANAPYTYSQQIYLQNEINQGGVVNKLRFFIATPYNSNPTNSQAWVVYMGHTSKTTFTSTSDWIPASSLTTVYSGNIAWPAGGNNWLEITLNNSFFYNNTDNLVIAVDENTGGSNSSLVRWGVFSASPSNRVIRYYDSAGGTNPNPSNPPLGSPTTRASAPNRIQLEITPLCTAPIVTINGSSTLCTGSNNFLTANATSVNGPITNYQWQLFNTDIIGANDSVYSPLASGTYTVLVIDSTGCPGISNSFNVSVVNSPIVSLSGSTTFCAGDSTLLVAGAIPGSGTITSFQWQYNGVDINGANSANLYVTSSGIYNVVVTNSNGCSTVSSPLNVSQSPLPVANFSYNTNGLQVTFTNNTSDGTSFVWDFGDGSPASNATDPIHSFPFDGVYTVTLTATNACGSNTFTQTIVIYTTGIQEHNSVTISVTPNPANHFVMVLIDAGTDRINSVKLTGITGNEIFSESSMTSGNLLLKSIDVSKYSKGTYVIQVTTTRSFTTKLLIID